MTNKDNVTTAGTVFQTHTEKKQSQSGRQQTAEVTSVSVDEKNGKWVMFKWRGSRSQTIISALNYPLVLLNRQSLGKYLTVSLKYSSFGNQGTGMRRAGGTGHQQFNQRTSLIWRAKAINDAHECELYKRMNTHDHK